MPGAACRQLFHRRTATHLKAKLAQASLSKAEGVALEPGICSKMQI